MRFGIDLDGVLADFGAKVVEVGNSLWPGKFPPDYVPDNWNYDGYLTSVEWKVIWAKIKSIHHFWETLKEAPGLGELITFLDRHRAEQDEIYFITARAATVGSSPMVQSAVWLQARGLWPRGARHVVISVADPTQKALLFRGLGVKFMLDDHAPTVEALNNVTDEDGNQFMQAYVLDQPWNRYATALPRVYSVTEYLEKIHS